MSELVQFGYEMRQTHWIRQERGEEESILAKNALELGNVGFLRRREEKEFDILLELFGGTP